MSRPPPPARPAPSLTASEAEEAAAALQLSEALEIASPTADEIRAARSRPPPKPPGQTDTEDAGDSTSKPKPGPPPPKPRASVDASGAVPPPKPRPATGALPPPKPRSAPVAAPAGAKKDAKPSGYNMSWYCVHSMAPLPQGCSDCGLPPADSGKPTKPAMPGARPPPPSKTTPAKPPPPASGRPTVPPPPGSAAGKPPKPKPPLSTVGKETITDGSKPPKPARPEDRPTKPSRPDAAGGDKPVKPPPPASSATGSASKPPKPPPPGSSDGKPAKPPPPGAADGKPAKPPPPGTTGGGARSAVAPKAPGDRPAKPKPSGPPKLPERPGPGHPLYHYMITGPKAQVQFPWEGAKEGDLTLETGQTIRLIRWLDPEWLEGDLDGEIGMFPAIMVDIETQIPVEGPRAVALFDFDAALPHELSFGEGEEIGLLGYIDEAWLRGLYHGKEGAFPAEFVEVVEDLPGPREYEGWPEEWIPEEDPLDAGTPQEEDDDVPPELLAASEAATAAAIAAGNGTGEAFEPTVGVEPAVPLPLPKPKPKPRPRDDAGAATAAAEPSPVPTPKPRSQAAATAEPTPAAKPQPKPEIVKTPKMSSLVGDLPTARVLHDYEASHPDELSIYEGQIITLLEEVDDEWLRGGFGMHEGIFPASFVEVLVPLPEGSRAEPDVGAPPLPDTTSQPDATDHTDHSPHTTTTEAQHATAGLPHRPGKAMVLHDYEPQADGDLPLVAGKTVNLLCTEGPEWLRGRLRNGYEGIFPRSYVEVLEEPVGRPEGLEDEVAEEPHAMALYDYDAQEIGDLRFAAGQRIALVERLDTEWYRGQLDGHAGIFPASFVEVVVDL